MRKTREILRLRLGECQSLRVTASSVGVSSSTVHDVVARLSGAGLSWQDTSELGDEELEARLYAKTASRAVRKVQPNPAYLKKEMRRKGVTLQLLWQEYKVEHPEDGLQYSQFCSVYRQYEKTLDVVLRQDHKAGDKAFIDWSGDKVEIIDPQTGEVGEAELFVAVLGASNFTFARAFRSQQLQDWIQGHMLAFEFFQGVPAALVPDNTKTAVTTPCLYEPDLNPTYTDMARHYNTAVLPARSCKPKDKAKVEGAVLLAQRWILAALRNHTFFSIDEANTAIAAKLKELNERPFQKLDSSRVELFETLEKSALRPLPPKRFEYADWSKPKVNIDYHVAVEGHFYSVPYTLIHKRLEARRTATTVELFFKGRRIASHQRSYNKGGHTTKKIHMPKAHQQYLEWSPTRILGWAKKTGPATCQVAAAIMATRKHPEQGYKACLGILRLGKKFGDDRVEAACKKALTLGSPSYKTVKSMLNAQLDKQELPSASPAQQTLPIHKNVRGPTYYQ